MVALADEVIHAGVSVLGDWSVLSVLMSLLLGVGVV